MSTPPGTRDHIRELAIALLRDEHGISEEAYEHLSALLHLHELQEDLTRHVAITEGRAKDLTTQAGSVAPDGTTAPPLRDGSGI